MLFIDSNIFIYLLFKQGNWEKVGRIFDSQKLVTSMIVLNELRHKLFVISASKILKTQNKYAIIKFIKNDKEFRESIYKKYFRFYTSLLNKVIILGISADEELPAASISTKFGLLPSDAAIVTSMQKHNITKILTNDSDFEKVDFIEVVKV